MEIVKQILGFYIPLCCLSLPVLGFFILVALLPVTFLSLTRQKKEQAVRSKE